MLLDFANFKTIQKKEKHILYKSLGKMMLFTNDSLRQALTDLVNSHIEPVEICGRLLIANSSINL